MARKYDGRTQFKILESPVCFSLLQNQCSFYIYQSGMKPFCNIRISQSISCGCKSWKTWKIIHTSCHQHLPWVRMNTTNTTESHSNGIHFRINKIAPRVQTMQKDTFIDSVSVEKSVQG